MCECLSRLFQRYHSEESSDNDEEDSSSPIAKWTPPRKRSYTPLLKSSPTPVSSKNKKLEDTHVNWIQLPLKRRSRTIATPEEFATWQNYRTVRKLGEGGFGVVNQVERKEKDPKTGKTLRVYQLACKVITLKVDKHRPHRVKRQIESLRVELGALQRLKDHPYVVNYVEHYLLESAGSGTLRAFIYMEFCDGGTLKREVKNARMPRSLVRRYFKEVALGLEFIHRNYIAHLDMKLDNVLMARSKRCSTRLHCKISDFGLSALGWGDDEGLIRSNRARGTANYMAPEILSLWHATEEDAQEYDQFKADIWALGVMLYYMIKCDYPYATPDSQEDPNYGGLLNELAEGVIRNKRRTWNDFGSKKLTDLLGGMLQFEPKRRLRIDQITRHPWVKKK